MKKISPEQICFGLNRELDEQSFACFLQLAGRAEFAEKLASRMSSEEISQFISDFTKNILKKHLSENEYHTLFLQQKAHGSEVKDLKG
ncbi:cytoplasmic protein [Desulfosediminicola flagellatus]|uniref:cytoplasmic protein n=1 Tax=Desulfosediminicola flagellatus TaxID=2569541 RepID=UPI0010ABA36A|nr:cytoplasmic protein [Desulfosediminicola flagellatus]